MKTVLITGLDGSGKSTLLNTIEKKCGNKAGILRVPVMDAELFSANQKIYKACNFVNWLNNEADSLKLPQLKAASLFASMLVFRDLYAELAAKKPDCIFCERHPLIDTAVYARFYSDKMDPEKIPVLTLAEIDYNFNSELVYFTNMLGLKKADMPKGAMYQLMQYMYCWFYVDKKTSASDLKELYKIELPDHIFYLRASPSVLWERIKDRKSHEAHEKPEHLAKLVPAYAEVLSNCGVKTESINSDDTAELEVAPYRIMTTFVGRSGD
jgi:thymidylate kinase